MGANKLQEDWIQPANQAPFSPTGAVGRCNSSEVATGWSCFLQVARQTWKGLDAVTPYRVFAPVMTEGS